jgi:uncharacterized protein
MQNMEQTEIVVNQDSAPALVAPLWHTVLVIIILLGLSGLGAITAHFQGGFSTENIPSRLPSYIVTIFMEWLVLGIIWLGIRGRGVRIRELIGGAWHSPKDLVRDIGISLAFLLSALVVLGLIARALHAAPNDAVRRLIPQTRPEIALYLLLALSAGFCEEVVFRGYLQRQFSVVTRNPVAGLVLQALLFGAAHGYQGIKYMLLIAVYGCMFGLLAQYLRSLRPGIIAHFLQDGGAGLIARHSSNLFW